MESVNESLSRLVMYPVDSVLIAFVALFVLCPHHKYISSSTQYAHSVVIYDSKPNQATSDDIWTLKAVFFYMVVVVQY